MPVWQVALVLNLTFAVGLGLGYAGWGRRAEALDREVDAARAFVKDRGIPWAQAYVGDDAGQRVLEDYGVDSIPATFLIDPDGKVIARGIRGESIKRAVTRALGRP
jgi:hypothetical protein